MVCGQVLDSQPVAQQANSLIDGESRPAAPHPRSGGKSYRVIPITPGCEHPDWRFRPLQHILEVEIEIHFQNRMGL